jgi:hypothetical protein
MTTGDPDARDPSEHEAPDGEVVERVIAAPPAAIFALLADARRHRRTPLKLVRFEGQGEPGSINHLGVETQAADEVVAAEARLTETGLASTGVDDTQCCYAANTETWLA